MTKHWLTVERDGKDVAVEIEECTPDERRDAIGYNSAGRLHLWIDVLCEKILELLKKD